MGQDHRHGSVDERSVGTERSRKGHPEDIREVGGGEEAAGAASVPDGCGAGEEGQTVEGTAGRHTETTIGRAGVTEVPIEEGIW